MREEELGAVDGKSGNDVPPAIQVPEERRAKCGLVDAIAAFPSLTANMAEI